MLFAKGPVTPVSFVRVPLHFALTVLEIIFILSVISIALFPVKLSYAFHFAVHPVSHIKISFHPLVHAFTMKFIVKELSHILFNESCFHLLLKFEVLNEGFIDE
jgi:hypothetical protein